MRKEETILGSNNSEKDHIRLGIRVHCDIFEYVPYLHQECVLASGDMDGLLSVNILDKIKKIQHCQSLFELYQDVFNSSESPIFKNLCDRLSIHHLDNNNHKKEGETLEDKRFWFDFKPLLISKFIEYAKKSAERSRAELQKQSITLKQTLEKCNQTLTDLKKAQDYELFKEKIINWLSSYECLRDKQFQQEFRKCPSHSIISFAINEYKNHIKSNSDNVNLHQSDSSFSKLIERQRQDQKLPIKYDNNNKISCILTLKVHNLLLSDVIQTIMSNNKKDITEYRIFVSGIFYLDTDLTIPGTNVNFQAKVVDCVNRVVINTTGRNANPIIEKKAKCGRQRRIFANIPNGDHGINGSPGDAGESAGNLQIVASKILHPENLAWIFHQEIKNPF
jgi:hypothetical protein